MSKQENPEAFYTKLKAQLHDTALWPTAYLYKFIVKSDASKIEQIEAIFNHLGAVISTKESSNGKYTSISINVRMKVILHNFILIDDIEYNTEREHLIIPEYGRHVQKMVNFAVKQETKEERNKVAKAIIAVMGNLQPHLRDVPDFQHKLWDQLFIMSNFELDADSPFEKPSKEVLEERPEPLKYPQNFPKYRLQTT